MIEAWAELVMAVFGVGVACAGFVMIMSAFERIE